MASKEQSMDFTLSKEHKMIQNAAREFARKELEPIVDEMEEKEEFPVEVFRKAGELGFLGPFFPDEYGGGAWTFCPMPLS